MTEGKDDIIYTRILPYDLKSELRKYTQDIKVKAEVKLEHTVCRRTLEKCMEPMATIYFETLSGHNFIWRFTMEYDMKGTIENTERSDINNFIIKLDQDNITEVALHLRSTNISIYYVEDVDIFVNICQINQGNFYALLNEHRDKKKTFYILRRTNGLSDFDYSIVQVPYNEKKFIKEFLQRYIKLIDKYIELF
jgi:hypothetical protein